LTPSDDAKQRNESKQQQKIIRSNQMKKLSILTCTMIALGFMATTVLAQNAHFMKCDSSVNNNGSLSVSFRIAGLGGGASDLVTASTTVTATWGCLNGGQECPNAANKFTTTQPITGQLSVTAGHNGSASGTITLSPTQPSNFCPHGQKMVLISVTWTDVTLTNNASSDTCTTDGGSGSFFSQCP
jgi:hypothetical protein